MASTSWQPPQSSPPRAYAQWPAKQPVIVLFAAAAAAITYLLDPHGVGVVIFACAVLACLMGIAIGPWRHRVRLTWFRALPVTAASLFLIGILARSADDASALHTFRLPDVASFSGYASLALWLRLLVKQFPTAEPAETLIDTLLLSTGAGLMAWTLAISPGLSSGPLTETQIFMAIYPVWDVILILLTTQIWYRVGAPVPALAWFFSAVVVLLVVDVLYTWVWLHNPGIEVPALTTLYLFVYAGFALGLSHPSIPYLAHPPTGRVAQPARHGRHSALAVIALSPALTCLVYPVQTRYDAAVRAALTVASVALVYLRLHIAFAVIGRAEQHSRHLSARDPLTSLGNRTHFTRSMTDLLRAETTNQVTVGAILLDFDGFKRVNDLWGHAIGDQFLCAIADRLRTSTPDSVLVRLGGDEFFVGVTATQPQQVTATATQIQQRFDAPLRTPSGVSTTLTPSIGLALATQDKQSQPIAPNELLRRADVALYHAKRAGGGRVVPYEGDISQMDRTRRQLGDDLTEAIRDRDIYAQFQPIVAAQHPHHVTGWEALARWNHPRLGPVGPDVFIPIAEERGLLNSLTLLVLQDACDFTKDHQVRATQPHHKPWVSINLSAAQIAQPDFIGNLVDAIQCSDCAPETIRVEMTEQSLIYLDERMTAGIAQLRQAGIIVLLDDFGSGFAGIGVLRRLHFDAVKLDRTFLTEPWPADRPRLLHAVTQLARSLGIQEIVAEGVETHDESLMVQNAGIDQIQGWHYGKPALPSSGGGERRAGGVMRG